MKSVLLNYMVVILLLDTLFIILWFYKDTKNQGKLLLIALQRIYLINCFGFEIYLYFIINPDFMFT